MRETMLSILACPACQGALASQAEEVIDAEVVTGTLSCRDCAARFPVSNGIPRFVPVDNYANSFGFQWNRFRQEQLDSANQTRNSRRRFETETGWTREWMAGKRILDAGCGSGRFLEIAAEGSADVVGVDISNAVDAARENLRPARNVHLVQASIDKLPFRAGVFDGVYCLGVLQHTPEPCRVVQSLTRVLSTGGRLAITAYERKPWTLLAGKYLVRPVTRRLPQRLLLAMVRFLMPALFVLTEVLFRIPLLRHAFMFAIPVSNYVDNPQLSIRQRYRWAVLDTFDALSPRYDHPFTQPELDEMLCAAGVAAQRGRGVGLNMVGEKQSQPKEEALAGMEH